MMNDHLQWMYTLERFGIKPGLGAMEEIMEALGHPERQWPSVHIAGTVGKGSTAAFMASVLGKAGYRVGLYTSPHVVTIHERIQIDGQQITDGELALLSQEMRGKLEAKSVQATLFEFTTALAFLYFARQHIDIAVIEVGMGGRLDATNVITPIVSVITTIGLDHEQFLGGTLAEVAGEKAGIMKAGVPVVVGEQNSGVLALLRKIAQKKQAPLYAVPENMEIKVLQATLDGQRFLIKPMAHPGGIQSTGHLPGSAIEHFEIGLLGRHQIDNAATALLALGVVQGQGWKLPAQALQDGLRETVWPGRMQILSRQPLVVVDGAHNQDGFKALYQFIKDWPRHDVLVAAAKNDKNFLAMYENIVPLFTQVVVTEGTYEPMPADLLAQAIRPYAQQLPVVMPSALEAVAHAKSIVSPDGTMLITGSLYMIGAVYKVY
ncbi:MAG: bifunctional folylpolyglutamate synthase/dihydrofolate synthase [Candidatus Sungbacteria bacterium]|nr:bifunctional folylpolyglutamate synthase/dihydrofolate synthase [Candidatus Sungbacteria bacterium]